MDAKVINGIKDTMVTTLIIVINDLKTLESKLKKEMDKQTLSKCIETLKVVAACEQVTKKLGEKNVNP